MRLRKIALLMALAIPGLAQADSDNIDMTRPQHFTTPSDIEAERRKMAGTMPSLDRQKACIMHARSAMELDMCVPHPPGPVPVQAAQLPPALPASVPPPAPRGGTASACKNTKDITQMLSPACLTAVTDLASGGHQGGEDQNSYDSGDRSQTKCSVAVYPKTSQDQTAALTSLQTHNLQECIELGVRLTFGIQSYSNITAVDPNFGVVGVACIRKSPDGQHVSCLPQPKTQGEGEQQAAETQAANGKPAGHSGPTEATGKSVRK